MRLRLLISILSATGLLALASDAPQMTDISQKAAKPGEIITVSGLGLNSGNIDEIYLTDHKFDMRVKVLEQKDTTIKFRVPPFAKPGRTQLLFLTKGDEPKLLEQPVYLLIEDPETEIAVAKPAPEAVNQESAKTEEIKVEGARPDQVKSEAATEQVKVDQVKPVLAKPDLSKPDLNKQDLNKQDPHQPKL